VQSFPNKKKIINDPVYGFVNITSELIFDLIEHSVFQRLRRIKQLGLSNLVYPGALHTRFQHVIGAMSLTAQAVDVLRTKGIEITDEEKDAVCAAVFNARSAISFKKSILYPLICLTLPFLSFHHT
jgi:HD superfamily phosphohydrolase